MQKQGAQQDCKSVESKRSGQQLCSMLGERLKGPSGRLRWEDPGQGAKWRKQLLRRNQNQMRLRVLSLSR